MMIAVSLLSKRPEMMKKFALVLVFLLSFHAAATGEIVSSKEKELRQNLKGVFETAGKQYGIEPSLLAAIASRESNTGLTLKSGYGYNGNEYGIMQINKRYHSPDTSVAPDSLANIIYGAKILRQSIDDVTKKHPDWSKSNQIRGGIAAYNFGVKNVQTVEGIDIGTTGGNYSKDVLERKDEIDKAWSKKCEKCERELWH